MKHLKLFEGYQSESEVAKICRKYQIKDWSINSEGLVDVDGGVDLSHSSLTSLPLRFGKITDYFDCIDNKLTSLEGSPHTVDGYFDCANNKLTSLEYCPKKVGGNFWCINQKNSIGNKITSFYGPIDISGCFQCSGNPIFEIWEIAFDNSGYKWDSTKMELFNDLDIIRGDEIVIDRLNYFLEEIGRQTVTEVKGYKSI